MYIKSKETASAKCFLRLPSFVSEDKREEKAVARMNDFYSCLEKEIKAYCESLDFPQGAKYKADFFATEKDSTAEITVVLSLRHRGRTQRKQTLCHMWQNGVIIKSGQ